MPSSGFLQRSVRVLGTRAEAKREAEKKGGQRVAAVIGGLLMATLAFFVLKGAAMASGIALPGTDGLALWLAGPDPVSSVVGATLQPLFAGRA